MIRNILFVITTIVILFFSIDNSFAQGDGPRTMLLAPKDMNIVTPAFLYMSSNFNFAQDILIEGADINSSVIPVTYIHYFSINDMFAQIWVTPIWGNVKGSINNGMTTVDVPTTSGFADPYLAMRIGIIGAPALTLEEFKKHKQSFQLHGLLGVNIPIGDYKQSRPVNLGTNRWAFRIGAPMVFPLGNNPARPFFLEITPSVMLYTDNTEPYGAKVRKQSPLLIIESHLSHNFTSQLWADLDLRIQQGGGTETDGISDDNTTSQLGGGATIGYNILPPLGVQVGYGRVFLSDKDKGSMLRFRVTMMF